MGFQSASGTMYFVFAFRTANLNTFFFFLAQAAKIFRVWHVMCNTKNVYRNVCMFPLIYLLPLADILFKWKQKKKIKKKYKYNCMYVYIYIYVYVYNNNENIFLNKYKCTSTYTPITWIVYTCHKPASQQASQLASGCATNEAAVSVKVAHGLPVRIGGQRWPLEMNDTP